MPQNAYIINCDDEQTLQRWVTEGYVSAGIYAKLDNDGKPTRWSLLQSYSMYADMSAVRPGDLILIHCCGTISGVYEAASEFCEDPSAPPIFHSQNIHWDSKPSQPESGWNHFFSGNSYDSLEPGHYRQAAIRPYVQGGDNRCYPTGFEANLVFKLKKRGRIYSIPDRWLYPDSSRTIRPILRFEVEELLELLENANYGSTTRQQFSPKDLSSFLPLSFILNPNIVTNEKLLEGYLCSAFRGDEFSMIFGKPSSIVNNFQIGYLQGVDIYGYTTRRDGRYQHLVIELKKDRVNNPDAIRQLREYMSWVVEFMANGNELSVHGFFVASGFSDSVIAFVDNLNRLRTFGRIELVRYNRCMPDYERLLLGVCNEH